MKKIVTGFVVQEFDEATKVCESQEFISGDIVEWEDECGNGLDPLDGHKYCPYEMEQPKKPMDKLDLLFIRACKSGNALKRVQSVYRRYYYGLADSYDCMANILLDICEKYDLIKMSFLISELDPRLPINAYKLANLPIEEYHLQVCRIFISKIRCSRVDKFDGFKSPCRFNKRHIEKEIRSALKGNNSK